MPIRVVIRELSALVRRTIVASAAAETTRITAYIRDQRWDEALRGILVAKDLDVVEDPSTGIVTIRTSVEMRALRNQSRGSRVVSTKRRVALVADLVRPTLADGVTITPDTAGNRLVISGPTVLLDDAVKLIQIVDGSASAPLQKEDLYVGTTAEIIRHAATLYGSRNLSGALANFRHVTLPSFLQPVQAEERITAFKYLGAVFADLGQRDSARMFFVAARSFDPFVELKETSFTDAARAEFETAGWISNTLAIEPVRRSVVHPDSTATAYPFRVVTTRESRLRVELVSTRDSSTKQLMFDGTSKGPRELRWPGRLSSGQLADTAVYELRARAASIEARQTNEKTVSVFFRLEHVANPAGDTVALRLSPSVAPPP